MLKTKARIDALAADITTLRDDVARLGSSFQDSIDRAVSPLRADMDARFDASREEVDRLRNLLRRVTDEETARTRDLRDEIARLRETIDQDRRERERLSNSVAKLERRLQQHADDLRTASLALLARAGRGNEPGSADPRPEPSEGAASGGGLTGAIRGTPDTGLETSGG